MARLVKETSKVCINERAIRGPNRRLRKQGSLLDDKIRADINRGDVECCMIGDGSVGKAPSCYNSRATGVVEDPEWLVGWWVGGR